MFFVRRISKTLRIAAPEARSMRASPTLKHAMGQPPAARPCLGVLMLDTRFPRLPGDVGKALHAPDIPRQPREAGAEPRLAVPSPRLLGGGGLAERLVAAAQRLRARGAPALTTGS